MEILPSALKHGFTKRDITHAAANAMVIDWVEDGLLFIGVDPTGHHCLRSSLARPTPAWRSFTP